MKKYTYILIDKNPKRGLGILKNTPIAIFSGDSKEETVRNIIRILSKWVSDGDLALIMENEALIEKSRKAIEEIIENEDGGEISIDGMLICITPISFFKDRDPDEFRKGHLIIRDLIVDKLKGQFTAVVNKPNDEFQDNSYYVDLVTNDFYDSPFIFPSPFILRGEEIFAVDSKTGLETGPYIKVEEFGSNFVVHSADKVGVLTSKGSLMLDCIYDGVYPQWRHLQLIKDGKMGLYSKYGNVLIPCEYDEFQFPEHPNDPVIAIKGTRKGYISVDGTFHPVDEETEDFSDLDPTLDYI